MRLGNVERGDRLSSKLLFAVVRLASGFRMLDVVRTLSYHPHQFGTPPQGPHGSGHARPL